LSRVFRIAGLLVLGACVAWVVLHRDLITTAAIETWLRGLGFWAPAGFVLIYAVGTVVFFSGALLSLAGGALFGPVWGTLWNLLGALLGATLAFLIARFIGAAWISQRLGGRLKRVIDGVEAEGWRFVAVMRLVPLVPFSLLNYALGLTRISLPAYILASAVCMLPGALAYTWLGYASRSAVAGDSSALRYGLFGLGALALIAFLPRLFRRFRRSAQEATAPPTGGVGEGAVRRGPSDGGHRQGLPVEELPPMSGDPNTASRQGQSSEGP
jgi:uncharacterized membrane protein YdjX (TVP38/TMEM64 family)